MTHIYTITDNKNGNVYVGSTKQKIHRRMLTHKNQLNCSSKIIINNNDYTVEIIEECTEDTRQVREQYYIDTLDCVNIKNTIFDSKAYKRKYYEEHIEDKKLYDKSRRKWKHSWGETYRDTCNFTYINTDLFC
tara:strand:+ start:27 stop:425 length:399 start_codon:yes stop_codon:yes gene_type:complete